MMKRTVLRRDMKPPHRPERRWKRAASCLLVLVMLFTACPQILSAAEPEQENLNSHQHTDACRDENGAYQCDYAKGSTENTESENQEEEAETHT